MSAMSGLLVIGVSGCGSSSEHTLLQGTTMHTLREPGTSCWICWGRGAFGDGGGVVDQRNLRERERERE